MSPKLSAKHRESLEVGSSIAPEIIAARGYRTVTNRAELRELGFSPAQAKVPALLIPVWGVTGEQVLYQLRPDHPRMINGKMVKYETPKGSQMVLDVHPTVRHMLVDPHVPLWVPEGIKKGDSLASRGCCTVSLLGVWNWRGTNQHGGKVALADWEYIALNGRQVYIVFDSDVMVKMEVHAALIRIGAFLKSRGANVGFVYLPTGAAGAKQGIDDFFAGGKTMEDVLALSSPDVRPLQGQGPISMAPLSAADRAVASVLESGAELFHDQLGEPHIAYEDAGGRRQVWPLKSKAASSFIRWRFLKGEGKGLNGDALATARATLVAKAQFEGQEHHLSVRVARTDDGFYYDLGDWRAVLISETGWRVVDKPPILFRHFQHQAVQRTPKRGDTLDSLLALVNLSDQLPKLLLKVYLIASLIPNLSMPILAVCGEQGSAKSTLFRLIRALIDPSNLASLSPPDNLREFVQLAAHHRAVYFDNLSHLPEWLSDALCRLCSGDGFSKRELYTDDDDVVYAIRGLGGVNGINLVATKPDLLDRAIIVRLDAIPPEKRLSEQALLDRFEVITPSILGTMFDILARAISRHRTPRALAQTPRMADFALWGIDIAEALGHEAEEFVRAYADNVQRQNESALEESPVAQAILAFLVGPRTEWEGTASDLLAELESRAQELRINVRAKEWPKAANVLSRRLREAVPGLRRAGCEVIEQRTSSARKWKLTRQRAENTGPSVTTAETEAKQADDSRQQASSPTPQVSSPAPPASSSQKGSTEYRGDDGRGSDGVSPTLTAPPNNRKTHRKDKGEV